MSYISVQLRNRVAERAQHLCEYCRSSEAVLGMPFEIEHIIPIAGGGKTHIDNLCLACPRCNRFKGTETSLIDPQSGQEAHLFNPRLDNWLDHFAWTPDGIDIVGRTPVGRVTVDRLQMNNPYIRRARYLWLSVGWHPMLRDD